MSAGHVYQREGDAQADCQWWQQVLRLQDWDVRVRFAREREMVAGHSGEVEMDLEGKRAVVRLLDQVDYAPNEEWPQDHEYTLVHELVHLHLEPVFVAMGGGPAKGSAAHVALEQAVHAIAGALVNLRRRNAGV